MGRRDIEAGRSFVRLYLRDDMKKQLRSTLRDAGSMIAKFTAVASVGFGALVVKSVQLAAAAETTEVAFETMLGSAVKAKKLVKELEKFSAATPFEPTEIKDGAKQLLAFGVSQDMVLDRFKTLGDIAAGSGARISDLVSVFGKARSAGVVALGDLNQLGDRGIPIFETLKKQLSLTGAELRKFVSAGKLEFPALVEALESMTREGGLFNDAMVKQSATINGMISTLKGEFDLLLTGFGKSVTESAKLRDNFDAMLVTIRQIDTDKLAAGVAAAANFADDVNVGLKRAEAIGLQAVARQEERVIEHEESQGRLGNADLARRRLRGVRLRQAKLLAEIEAAERRLRPRELKLGETATQAREREKLQRELDALPANAIDLNRPAKLRGFKFEDRTGAGHGAMSAFARKVFDAHDGKARKASEGIGTRVGPVLDPSLLSRHDQTFNRVSSPSQVTFSAAAAAAQGFGTKKSAETLLRESIDEQKKQTKLLEDFTSGMLHA